MDTKLSMFGLAQYHLHYDIEQSRHNKQVAGPSLGSPLLKNKNPIRQNLLPSSLSKIQSLIKIIQLYECVCSCFKLTDDASTANELFMLHMLLYTYSIHIGIWHCHCVVYSTFRQFSITLITLHVII